jgi:CelD/BcsL family acetyltransferase involved in cellulose biosynthesis
MSFRVELVSDIEAFDRLHDAWDDLFLSAPQGNMFVSHEWLATWWRHFSGGRQLVAVTVYGGDTLVAAAPLMVSPRTFGLPLRKLTFIGEGRFDCVDFLVRVPEESCLALVFEALLGSGVAWDVCELGPLPADSPVRDFAVRLSESSPLASQDRRHGVSPAVSLPTSWDQFRNGMTKSLRDTVKHRTRQLQRDFGLEFERVTDPTAIEGAMQGLFSMHQRRWEARREAGSFPTSELRAFHLAVARKLHDHRRLHLWSLRVGGATVAAVYAMSHRQTMYLYSTAFAPDWARYSVGSVLLAHCLEDAIAQGYTVFDFLGGEEAYKYRWGAHDVHLHRVLLRRPTVKGRVLERLLAARDLVRHRRKARLLRRSPSFRPPSPATEKAI